VQRVNLAMNATMGAVIFPAHGDQDLMDWTLSSLVAEYSFAITAGRN
jgi:hypothetical protein